MKKYFGILAVAGALLLSSCVKEKEAVCTITADRTAITDVACQNPADEPVVITTDAPYWIVITPSWIKADPVTAPGGGNSICTLSIASSYKDENTDVPPRSGEVVFSGGRTKLVITVSQNGYTSPVDPDASIGGIPDVEEFRKFVSAVNNGGKINRWLNDAGEVELLDNLDLSSFGEWTPVGVPEAVSNGNNSSAVTGPAFSGVFNGAGHSINGFSLDAEVGANGTTGFFGVLKNATVKNLKISGSMNVSATGTADVGFVAGTVFCSTIDNVSVNLTVNSAGSSAGSRFSIGGIAGFVFCENGVGSTISNCTVNLNAKLDCGSNSGNGAGGVMFGGIAGFATAAKTEAARNIITDCVCNGEIEANIGRSSGICSTCNCGTILRNCTNNANQFNKIVNGRIGNIVCNLSVNSSLENCVNNGSITTSDSQTTTGGLAALIGDASVTVTGGKNTGTVIGGNPKYIGLIAANLSNFASITGVTVGGKLGYYKADGNHEMQDVNADNFQNFIGTVSDANRTKISDLKFEGDAPAPVVKGIASAADLQEFATLAATGGDLTKFMDGDAVVLAKDIDLGGVEWTPIGAGSVTTAAVIADGCKPYSGIFDGKGHKVDNFKVTLSADAPKETAAGLFGILDGAVVRNVVIGSKAVITSESKAVSYIGGVAGFAINSTIEGCTNEGTLSLTAGTDNIRGCLGGIVGQVYTLEGDSSASYVKECVNNGKLSSVNNVNTKNGATGLSVGGIAGFADGKNYSFFQNCTNKADIAAQATRLSGIVASANTFTKIDGCINEGNISDTDVKASNSRVAGIVSAGSTNVFITNCINSGNVSFPVAGDTTHGYAAGILGQANNPIEIVGCTNTGSILTDLVKAGEKYVGAILGNPNNKAVTISGCKVGGKVGPVVEDADNKVVTLSAENFEAYITLSSKKGSCKFEGNTCGN